MIDSTPSFRCKVNTANSSGLLRVGMRTCKVQILEMSRDSFSVRVPASIAKRIQVGRKSKLLYQEMLYSVLCSEKWIGDANQVDIEFKPLAELTQPKLQRGGHSRGAKPGMSVGQSDPTLPVALLGAFILALLIMPAWGGQWGTSEPLCRAISNVCSALSSLITGS
jgi:hypothetical protein